MSWRAGSIGSTSVNRRAPAFALLIVALCLLAFGLQTWGLGAQNISSAESLTVYRLGRGLRGLLPGQGMPSAAGVHDPSSPFYLLLLGVFCRLAGGSDFALRFLSVASAVLLVPLQYALGTRLWNRRAGAIAALLGALSPLYLACARQARMYTLAAMLGLLAVYALDRGLAEGRPGWLAAAVLGALFAVGTTLLGLAFLPLLAAQALLSGRVRRLRRPLIVAGILIPTLAGLLALGLALPSGAARHGAMATHYAAKAGLDEALRGWLSTAPAALYTGLHAHIADPGLPVQAALPVDLLCLGLALIGAFGPTAMQSKRTLPALYVAILLLATAIIALAGPAFASPPYLILAAPALYLLLARGAERCATRLWPLALAAGLVIASSMGLAAHSHLLALGPLTGPDYRAAAQAIELRERSRDVIVTTGAESMTCLLHYYHGRLPTIALQPAGSELGSVAEQAIANLTTRFDRLWLIETDRSDPQGRAAAWLEDNTFLVQSAAYSDRKGEAQLHLFMARPPFTEQLPPHQHSSQISFGSLALAGFDLPLQPVSGGECAWVTLYWRALYPRQVEVSLRLLDEQGREWARSQEVPYPAFTPERWPAESIVRHEAGLLIPPAVPPGWYQIELRLYDAANGRPIEPTSGAEPGPVTLGPLLMDATWSSQTQLVRLDGTGQSGDIYFGEDLILRAYRLGGKAVVPGQWLHTDFYWQISDLPGHDLTLSMELVDGRGTVIASRNVSPVTPQYPPASWHRGELLWGQHELLIPFTAEPGTYRLQLIMRDVAGNPVPTRDRWRFWSWGGAAATLTSLRVVPRAQPEPRPQAEHPLDALSTAGIDLLGFDGPVQSLRRGEPLEVTLHWHAAVVPAHSYKVSVQLLAGDGHTVLAQEDSIPAGWSRPTTAWAVGEAVTDTHRVTVPESASPQTATLIVALYDEDTGQRAEWQQNGQLGRQVVLCQVGIDD